VTRLIHLYLRFATAAEIATAWLLNVGAHPDHIGHPFF
jgi:hypothetical protein